MHRGISGPYFQALLRTLSVNTNFILKEIPPAPQETPTAGG